MAGKEFRDGDWTCMMCNNHNFRSREFCNQCAEPRKLADESMQHPGHAPVRQGDWICSICDNRNFASRAACHKCQAQKAVADLKTKAPAPKARGGGGFSGGYGGPNMGLMGGPAGANPALAGMGYGGYGGGPGNPMQAALLQNFMMQQAAQQAQNVGYGAGGYGAPGGHSNGRPGDWICPGCSNNNYAFRTKCHRCDMAKPGNMQGGFSQGGGGYSQGGGGYSQGGGGGGMVGGAPRRAGDWECPTCANVNFGFRVKCHKCQADKPEGLGGGLTDGGSGGIGGKRGADEAFSGNYNPPKMMKVGDWTCPNVECSNYNYAFRTECKKCNTPKLVAPPLDGDAGAGEGGMGAGVDRHELQ